MLPEGSQAEPEHNGEHQLRREVAAEELEELHRLAEHSGAVPGLGRGAERSSAGLGDEDGHHDEEQQDDRADREELTAERRVGAVQG